MQSTVSAAPQHSHASSFRRYKSTQKLPGLSLPGLGQRSVRLPLASSNLLERWTSRTPLQASAFGEPQSLQITLEQFQPNALEKQEFQPEVIKKYPVIGAAHKNLKKNSEAMRILLTQWIQGQPMDAKALERLEKRLSVMPAGKGWQSLAQQLEVFRPVKGWGDLLHNARTLVGIPGAMMWTASQTAKYLSTSEADWRANPENSLRAQILAHNRYLQFPEVHEASKAYWALLDWRTELQQRLQLLKTLSVSTVPNGKAAFYKAENTLNAPEAE